MKPFKKLSAYDDVPCEYRSSTSDAGRYLTKEQQDAMERMLKSMSETLIPESDVAALKSENASLRGAAQGLGELCDQLKAENERLRKLLQDVAICASGNYCYDCPHQHDGCDRDERLKAEGIEVPE